ncbi:MAG: hypothetical protein GF346_03585 [Candidatus Eisenbacteria bacterium]|nr:hypothetical protein [Candidatus Latescibacterota bacterium]MBD3301505.1 hypothetical protein [Candidatus Eisenbacteria bacterium]
MRSVLLLLASIMIMATAVQGVDRFDGVTVSASHRPGSIDLAVEDPSEDPFAEPILRLIALPPGATRPEAVLQSAAPLDLTLGEPMILRGIRVVPLSIEAQPGVGKTVLPSEARISLRYRPDDGASAPRAVRNGRGFFSGLDGWITGAKAAGEAATGFGSYLIITDPRFVPAVTPLADWKREKGLEVIVATTDETGTSNQQIKSYIRDLYGSSENPPAYVLIVGDTEQVPAWDYHSSVSDHPYALVDGDDFLPDLHVGRFSAQTIPEAETIVAKTLRHERDPYLEEGADWFTRGLVVGADYGSSTPVPVSRWCKQRMLDLGFSEVSELFYPPWWNDRFKVIKTSIDEGVSIVSYRGWAYGIHGWQPPSFTSDSIPLLNNGWKLPVVMSFVCQNNDFANEEDCFGEVWIRAGSDESPKGAVAVIGNSEPWSHTRHNDAAAIGAFKAISQRGVRNLGEILTAIKMEILQKFPTEVPYDEHADNAVEFYFYIYSLLGDPDLDLWTTAPREISVEVPDGIAAGSNFVEVRVTENGTGAPVDGAMIGVTQDGTVRGAGWTDASGVAHVGLDAPAGGAPLLVTVTDANVLPHQTTIAAQQGTGRLVMAAVIVDDDAEGASLGNGDGIPNPGERIELFPTLSNDGPETATGVAGTLTAPGAPWIDVLDGEIPFPDCPATGQTTAGEPFVVEIDPTAEDGSIARLLLEAGAVGVPVQESDLVLETAAPMLRYRSRIGTGAEEELVPGRTVEFALRLGNEGSLPSSAASAVLRSLDPEIAHVADSTAAVPAVEPGGEVLTEPFSLTISEDALTGAPFDLLLRVTTQEGSVDQSTVTWKVGPTQQTAPLGPDGYGYYAYDNSDTDYPDGAPLFDYITCSPVYGGEGTKLSLRNNRMVEVDLPFSFVFYGRTYDRILVSDNGWISFDLTTYHDYYNWDLPGTYGNGALIAPFWDNLDPDKEDEGENLVGDGVYVYHDEERDAFIVEWSRLANFFPELDDLQTFELILFDPAVHQTETGDGIIQFQYKQIRNNDVNRMFATVGIENPEESDGLQYTYINVYPDQAAPISSGLAIRITTTPARYVPFDLGRFAAQARGDGVALSWEPIDDRPRADYRIYRAPAGAAKEPTALVTLDGEARDYLDADADPSQPYRYWIGSRDPVGRETRVGPFQYDGPADAPLRLALESRSPNPARGRCELSYAVPRKGRVTLSIYDLSGRLVRTLIDGAVEAGVRNAVWDGRDDRGHDLPSGIYLGRLQAGPGERTLKMTLLR